MGRLFWKIFLAFLLTQALAALALYLNFALSEGARHDPRRPPEHWMPPDDWRVEKGEKPVFRPPGEYNRWPDFPGSIPPPPPPEPSPYLPVLALLLSCLSASALLAWAFAKPVRELRQALRAVAQGRLETRVRDSAGGWNDEISDLGQEFDRMAQELQQLVEAQRQLLHDVSHELRSPLARLQAAIGLARQNPAQLERTFDRIERESARLATLVDELLTLARLESGQQQTPMTTLDLVDLLADIAEDARFEAHSTGRDLAFVASGECLVRGRLEPLHRAFENVLRNAVKYTAPGSVVEVGIAPTAAQEAVVQVRDHGPGVAATDLERLFQPFFRAPHSQTEDGFGLGLAIARRAITTHRGKIRASLPPDGGLCVEIRLPLAERLIQKAVAS